MAKTTVRFNNENILDVDVDLSTHAVTGNVIDETTNTLYPIGGGGGNFEVVELEFEVLSGDCALNAPIILAVDPYYMVPSFLAIDSSMTLNTVISTANTTLITITPGAGSEVHEISGDIELLSDNNYILSGNAKVTIKAR